MKKLLAVFVLVFSFSALANRISFSYFGNNGNTQFYACDYVQIQTVQLLEAVGATNIYASCWGGITNVNIGPVSGKATFSKPVLTGKVEEVEIKGDNWNPNCGLNVTIMKQILRAFPEITVIEKRDACFTNTSNYYYKLSVPR